MYTRGIVAELLWFIKGSTNIQWLVQNRCNIWNGDAYKKYVIQTQAAHDKMVIDNSTCDFQPFEPALSISEFAEKIKTDDVFAKRYGDLGPIYGEQWRNFGGTKTAIEIDDAGNPTKWENTGGVDQFTNMINTLKTNPDGRRIIVTAWNPQNVHLATLPPCHYGFQVYTRELSENERWSWYKRQGASDMHHDHIEMEMNESNVPTREVSLLWNQRSVDTFLGLPFNIASYGILLEIIAKEVGMAAGEIVGFLGDTHLYSNHLDVAREQAARLPRELPTLNITLNDGQEFDIFNMKIENFQIANYNPHEKIVAKLSN